MRRPAQRMKERSKEYTVLYIHFDRVVQNSTEPNTFAYYGLHYLWITLSDKQQRQQPHTKLAPSINRADTHRRGMKRKRMNAEFSGRQKQRENNQSREKVVGFKWFFSMLKQNKTSTDGRTQRQTVHLGREGGGGGNKKKWRLMETVSSLLQ